MTPLPVAHEKLYTCTSALADELARLENEVKTQEKALINGIAQLTQAVHETSRTPHPPEVAQALQTYFDQTAQVLQAWEKKVGMYDAGLSFRKQFGDSMLVFVYGKVKAGKSSLGNYVACGRSQPDQAWLEKLAQAGHTPRFFGGEKNVQFEEHVNFREGFRVGSQETTGGIQGFTVPGMTWVDSPGLHSVNSQNGELAQKYVESADLIIYLMNTAQPGRQTDLQELETLLRAGKRILVLVTRCDEVDMDVDDQGQIVRRQTMKSAKSRRDQENYVQGELAALCGKLGITDADTDVLTISVAYAEDHGNTPQALADSGVQSLFDKLQGILQSDGIELKKQVPHQNLQAFYRLLLAPEGALSVTRLLVPIDDALKNLVALEARLEIIRQRAHTLIESQFGQAVDVLVEKHAQGKNLKALERELQQALEEAIDAHYRTPMRELYRDALGTLTAVTLDMGLCMGLEFTDEYASITLDNSGKAAAIWGGVGSLAGSLVGFLIGGPPGMALGGPLGGVFAGFAGSQMGGSETRNIYVGDNREQIKSKVLENNLEKIEMLMTGLNQQTVVQVLGPMRSALVQVQQHARHFKNYVQEQTRV